MKKILPIAIPPIIGYLHHAYPLSILANRTEYLPWFHSHYIQYFVREQITYLLHSRNTSKRFRMLANPTDDAYGLETYECLKHFLASFLSPPFSFDIRPAHILWEHKKCMAYRLKYMEAQGYLKSEDGFFIQYDEVARKIGVLRMMLLKFRKTRSSALIHRVCLHLDAIAEVEKRLLQNLLDKLESVAVSRDDGVCDTNI